VLGRAGRRGRSVAGWVCVPYDFCCEPQAGLDKFRRAAVTVSRGPSRSRPSFTCFERRAMSRRQGGFEGGGPARGLSLRPLTLPAGEEPQTVYRASIRRRAKRAAAAAASFLLRSGFQQGASPGAHRSLFPFPPSSGVPSCLMGSGAWSVACLHVRKRSGRCVCRKGCGSLRTNPPYV